MKIETIDEAIEESGIKICVFGLAGVGKTVLLSTIDGTIVVLSAEAGLLSLKSLPPEIKARMAVIQIKTLTDLGEAFVWLQEERRADWIGIDSISEIAETVLSNEMAESKDPRNAYGKMAEDMMNLIRSLRDLKDYNIIMTAKQAHRKDDYTGITSYVPMMPGQILTRQIPYMFDEMFCLRVEPHPEDPTQLMRVIQTSRDVMYDCKDRSGMLNQFEPADIAQIARKINGAAIVTPAAAILKEAVEDHQTENSQMENV